MRAEPKKIPARPKRVSEFNLLYDQDTVVEEKQELAPSGRRPLLLACLKHEPMGGNFKIGIKRFSMYQSLGVSFVNEDGNIQVVDAVPHFCVNQGDILVGINGKLPRTIKDPLGFMARAQDIEVTLRRPGKQACISTMSCFSCNGQGDAGDATMVDHIGEDAPISSCVGEQMQEILTTNQPKQLFHENGPRIIEVEFHRSFYTQKFGLELIGKEGSVAVGVSVPQTVYLATDLPHMGLRKGDRVDSVNGTAISNPQQFNRIADKSLAIRMKLTRPDRAAYDDLAFWDAAHWNVSSTAGSKAEDHKAPRREDMLTPVAREGSSDSFLGKDKMLSARTDGMSTAASHDGMSSARLSFR